MQLGTSAFLTVPLALWLPLATYLGACGASAEPWPLLGTTGTQILAVGLLSSGLTFASTLPLCLPIHPPCRVPCPSPAVFMSLNSGEECMLPFLTDDLTAGRIRVFHKAMHMLVSAVYPMVRSCRVCWSRLSTPGGRACVCTFWNRLGLLQGAMGT